MNYSVHYPHEMWPQIKCLIFNLISEINISSIFCKMADKSMLFLVMSARQIVNRLGCYPYVLYYYGPLLSPGWFIIAVCGSISVLMLNYIFNDKPI